METDHKALVQIFNKPLHECPPRLQRIFLRLQRYINLVYKSGKQLFIADTLSRSFFNETAEKNNLYDEIEVQICLFGFTTDEKIR